MKTGSILNKINRSGIKCAMTKVSPARLWFRHVFSGKKRLVDGKR